MILEKDALMHTWKKIVNIAQFINANLVTLLKMPRIVKDFTWFCMSTHCQGTIEHIIRRNQAFFQEFYFV